MPCGLRVVVLATILVAVSPQLNAMQSNSEDAEATITILRALEINQVRDLIFGDIIAATVAGSITVNPNSAVQTTGGVTHLGGNQAAMFAVVGEIGQSFSISLPSGPLSVVAGSNSMLVDNWTSNPVAGETIPGSGSVDLFVGATLTVAANQPAGNYQGSFAVSVAYD